MSAPDAIVATATSFLRAQRTGDRALLASVCLPHPDLDRLVGARPPAAAAVVERELEGVQISGHDLGEGRFLANVYFGGVVHLMLLRTVPGGPRVDPRYAIAAMQPDDERRNVIRAFYYALLTSHEEALHELAFDARGVDLLVGEAPPAGECGQLEHVASMMGIAPLRIGDTFVTAKGVETVNAKHAEHGIEVFSALTPEGELPFLLKQRDGAWKVMPFHFIQMAVVARGGSLDAP
jgi:hypothetical protein